MNNYCYYYNDHHLYQYYCYFNNQLFKSRAEYLYFCKINNILLTETKIFKKSKFALEFEKPLPGKYFKTFLAEGTILFDERDISNFYFNDEVEAFKFLEECGTINSQFLLEALFKGYEGEPDYSPDKAVENLLPEIEASIIPFNNRKEFKKIAHFIISYLPDDEVDKIARKQAHLNQIKSIKAITPYVKIHIIAQNYKDEDYLDDPQIVYYKYGKLGAMKARNTALNIFYNSNYDFCILNDDDVVAAPTDSARNFFKELEKKSKKFKDIDIIYSRDMLHHPFQVCEFPKIEKYNKNWVFEYTPMSVWHYTVIRNFKKFYGKEEYQTETIDPNTGVGYDDADFCYDLHMKGYKIWKCVNAVQSYAQNWIHLKNSVVYTDTTNPWIRLKNKKATETKWLLNDEGEVDEQAFVKRTGRKDFALMIPRHKKVNVINEFTQRNAKYLIDNYYYLDPNAPNW